MPNTLDGIGLENVKKKEVKKDNLQLAKDLIKIGRGSFVLKNIDKLGIESPKDRLEIAKKLLPKHSDGVISFMDKFGIQDEKDKLELIEMSLSINPKKVIECIGNLNIGNSNFGLEVARRFILAGYVPFVMRHLDKFKIEESSDRLKLAKQLANTDAYRSVLIENMNKFKIEDPKARLDLLESIIEKRGNEYRVIINIDKFDIIDERDRVGIAQKLIPNATSFVINNIEKFRIHNASDMLDISEDIIENASGKLFLNSVDEEDGLTVTYQHRTCENMLKKACNTLQPTDDLASKIKICKDKISNIERLSKFYDEGKKNINFIMSLGGDNEDKINNTIATIKEERRKDDARELVEKILFLRDNLDIKVERNDELTKLMEELMIIRHPSLKQSLMPFVFEFITNNKLDLIGDEMKNNDKKKAYPAINAIVFDKLSLYDKDNKDILDSIRKVFSKNSFLKNSKDVQETMMSLIKLQDLGLSNEVKRGVLKFLLKYPNDINRNCRYIMAIVSLTNKGTLQEITDKTDLNGLKAIFYNVYKQFVDFGDDDKLKKEYEQFVNKEDNLSRNLEERIIVHLSKHRDDVELIQCIENFVKTMSDGKKFKQERYDTSQSQHLQQLNDIDSKVYKKWSELEDKFKPIDTNNKAFITDDPIDLLLIGTEVDRSCQHIEYGTKNRCLMGYVVDGKNKAVVIKNAEGRIIARSIVRLLIESGTNKIVMTKERLYKANGVSDEVEDELENRCIEYAKWLGVPLVCEKDLEKMAMDMEVFNKYNSKEKYDGMLVSYSSVAPYEYTDMGLGEITERYFEVDNQDLVYLYKEG